ncbi:hypothetical protein XELAEV_18004309mg [Xenopus laevis]|uniref:Uncharacterized protein n=1 Tax=Xenopus laevis TaxID=8355 RepID=A0A974BPM0_XENLA|nr:hypothetical protein XELAEV_18004309mg [Xenopus laevis]
MASRAQLSTSLCRSSVKVPLRLEDTGGALDWGAGAADGATVLVLLVPETKKEKVRCQGKKEHQHCEGICSRSPIY